MQFDSTTLTYDANGLIPCIAQDHASGEVLMMAWMNAESLARTLESGAMTYWSRSRAAFWAKGETSGHVQRLVELRVDCDRDCLLALVTQARSGDQIVVMSNGGFGGVHTKLLEALAAKRA